MRAAVVRGGTGDGGGGMPMSFSFSPFSPAGRQGLWLLCGECKSPVFLPEVEAPLKMTT